MSNKMITIKGKQISEQTIIEALKKHCNFDDFDESKVPVFSKVKSCSKHCLIIKLTKSIREHFTIALSNGGAYLSLNENGDWDWGFYKDDTFQDVIEHFEETPQPVFE